MLLKDRFASWPAPHRHAASATQLPHCSLNTTQRSSSQDVTIDERSGAELETSIRKAKRPDAELLAVRCDIANAADCDRMVDAGSRHCQHRPGDQTSS